MLRRGFNLVSVDQDRFMEIYGNQPIHSTLASLDALIAGVVASMAESIYGNPDRSITVSDLRTLFKEGREGTLLVGDYDLNDPTLAASTFLSTTLMKGDVRASRGLLLQMMVPDGAPTEPMRSLLDAIFVRLGEKNKTVFISSMRNHDSERVDLFGIATGMDESRAQIQKALKEKEQGQGIKIPTRDASVTSRWDVPMVV
jgi:cell division GTPase FtsZ